VLDAVKFDSAYPRCELDRNLERLGVFSVALARSEQ
jgi:hypothetical protein